MAKMFFLTVKQFSEREVDEPILGSCIILRSDPRLLLRARFFFGEVRDG